MAEAGDELVGRAERVRLAELFYHADGFTSSLDSISEAPAWVEEALTEEHSGDCTKQPWSCMRCHAEDMIKIANYVADRWSPARIQSDAAEIAELKAQNAALREALTKIAWTPREGFDGPTEHSMWCRDEAQAALRAAIRSPALSSEGEEG